MIKIKRALPSLQACPYLLVNDKGPCHDKVEEGSFCLLKQPYFRLTLLSTSRRMKQKPQKASALGG